MAVGVFIVGMLLFGFGLLIFALPRLFALLAALLFFIAGAGCVATGVRIYLAIRRMEKQVYGEQEDEGRVNVRVHHEQDEF